MSEAIGAPTPTRMTPPTALPSVAALTQIVTRAIAAWREPEAVAALTPARDRTPDDARLWLLLAATHRAAQDTASALAAARRAAALAPHDALVAHTLARIAAEAGEPAVALFDRALALAPRDAGVMLGRAAALVAAGEGAAASSFLADVLRQHPGWYDGHATLARLRWQAGDRVTYAAGYAAALAAHPNDGLLWRDHAATVARAGQGEAARRIIAQARRALGQSRTLDLIEAGTFSEDGEIAAADRLYRPHLPIADADALAGHVRHLLRAGRADAARAALDGRLGHGTPDLWPLAALAWRLTGDPRGDWLERGGAFVRVFDLADAVAPIDDLAATLRALHRSVAAPLDQSLRGGTQTDGALFARLDPAIVRLRDAVLAAVARYLADLPAPDAAHPWLGLPRDRVRFAGSWSVRLTDRGHHVEHVHPAGWISSACYVALPDGVADDPARGGWLSVGDAPSLIGTALPEWRQIAPRAGKLVLFPSWAWHRTLPFTSGERLTVAFDIARPPL
ncbi:putative 2OG-Fe(II) oxygenase [uncultured Sphingomonas sp.]|uniref:putative 2OG-Fe(II) oxygenase n=1 Tax=uncultured Sphingomonas sp. TaxID=158754 RepID=UPI0025E75DF7|nr:putative 2OG-Fe(II) oxygenase [uncultured Sphingomonas sp.]